MSVAKKKYVLSMAVFAVVLMPWQGDAQMQQAESQQTESQQNSAKDSGLHQESGIWQPGSAVSPSEDVTANFPATNPSLESGGASSWSAGRGSFGARNAMPVASRGAEGTKGKVAEGDTRKSSWVAGRGSFGSTVQSGGIWRENGGFSATASTGSTNKPANGVTLPAVMPNFAGINSPFTIKPLSTPPAHAAVSHASSGSRTGRGSGLGRSSRKSSGLRSSGLGHTGTKPAATGLHGRTSTLNRSQTSFGIGTKPSGFGSTTPISSVFAPSSSTSGADTLGAGTAPVAPPQ